jgi:hypothetical protein
MYSSRCRPWYLSDRYLSKCFLEMNGYQFVRIGEEGQSKIYSSWNDFSQLAVGGLLCRNVIVKSLSPIYNLFPGHHSSPLLLLETVTVPQ